jgi:hypothetical protein
MKILKKGNVMRSVLISVLLLISVACSKQIPNGPPWSKNEELSSKYTKACVEGTKIARNILIWPESGERSSDSNYTYSYRLSPTSRGTAYILYNKSNIPTVITFDIGNKMGALIDYYVFLSLDMRDPEGAVSEDAIMKRATGEYFCYSEFLD